MQRDRERDRSPRRQSAAQMPDFALPDEYRRHRTQTGVDAALDALPVDVFHMITSYLKFDDIVHLAGTSKGARQRALSSPSPFPVANARRGDIWRRAAREGDVAWIPVLVSMGGSVDIKDGTAMTPLLYAAEWNRPAFATRLVELGADPNRRDWQGYTPLTFALCHRAHSLVHCLVAAGANVSHHLCDQIMRGHCDNASYLLSRGANANMHDEHGRSALALAAMRGEAELVQQLADAGADVNARHGSATTPLAYAAHNGHGSVVKKLIALGANCNLGSLDMRQIPLLEAVRHGHDGVVDNLLSASTDVDATERGGGTALELAAKSGYDSIVRCLLNAGADIRCARNLRRGVEDLATSHGHPSTASIIREHIDATAAYDSASRR